MSASNPNAAPRDLGGRRRVGLQRVVVARRDDRRAAAAEVIDDGDAERAAFGRIGARAHFVEQHQRRHDEIAIHRRDVGDVAGERAEARVDRLLVADVGEQRSEHRQPRALGRRNVQARLRHQRQQPRRLERDGLAAGVRPGDEQAGRRRQIRGDRHRAASGP